MWLEDSVNEYDVMDAFYSVDVEEVAFGFIGYWNTSEAEITEGGGNNPFNRDVLSIILLRCNEGVTRNEISYAAYC